MWIKKVAPTGNHSYVSTDTGAVLGVQNTQSTWDVYLAVSGQSFTFKTFTDQSEANSTLEALMSNVGYETL